MKKNILMIAAASAMIVSCASQTEEPELKISIFSSQIEALALQKGVTFEEAAKMVRGIGYTGADVRAGQDPAQIQTLRSLGFFIPSALVDIDFFEGDQTEAMKAAEDFMLENGISVLILNPGLIKDGADTGMTEKAAAFAAEAAAKGITVLVQDLENEASPCRTTAGIDRLLGASPELALCFDSGNWLAAGEDCMRPLEKFRSRIAHVHLKDRVSPSEAGCPAVGTGCIPVTYVIRSLVAGGYRGWFTVETDEEDILSAVTSSFKNVKAAIETEEMTPEMSEYYYPEVPRVEPVETCTAAPEGAVVLFDGSDLSAWQGGEGQDAGWKLNGDGTMTVDKSFGDIKTRREFSGKYLLHVEWCVPADVEGEGQSRGNSGVFLNDIYEVQVLDCFENTTYIDGQTASIYKQSVPSANPCRRPGEWNIYDITFTSPEVDADGTLLRRPRITVVFNGVLVQDDFEILGSTEYIGLPRPVWSVTGPVSLQSHGDPSLPISFRNIWYKQL